MCVPMLVTIHVETVVLLSHKKPDGHINVKVEFGESVLIGMKGLLAKI